MKVLIIFVKSDIITPEDQYLWSKNTFFFNYKYAKDVESNIDASSHSVNFKLNKSF